MHFVIVPVGSMNGGRAHCEKKAKAPPNFRYDRQRLAKFLELLPHDTADELKLARKHDARMKGREAASAGRRAIVHAQVETALIVTSP